MDKQKLQDLYCAANSKLTSVFNLGAIGKEYVEKLYKSDKNVIGFVDLVKVFPPITYEGSPVKDDPVAELVKESLENSGITVANDFDEYDALLKGRIVKYVQDIANMEGDVFTPFRKSILNMARSIYYDNVKYFAIKAGLPEEIEEEFISQLDDAKNNGFIDIHGAEDLSVEGLKAELHNVTQDVQTADDILEQLSLLMANSRFVESQKIEWFDKKLEDNFDMEDFIFGDGGFEVEWVDCEEVRVKKMYENATNVVAASVVKSMPASPALV